MYLQYIYIEIACLVYIYIYRLSLWAIFAATSQNGLNIPSKATKASRNQDERIQAVEGLYREQWSSESSEAHPFTGRLVISSCKYERFRFTSHDLILSGLLSFLSLHLVFNVCSWSHLTPSVQTCSHLLSFWSLALPSLSTQLVAGPTCFLFHLNISSPFFASDFSYALSLSLTSNRTSSKLIWSDFFPWSQWVLCAFRFWSFHGMCTCSQHFGPSLTSPESG